MNKSVRNRSRSQKGEQAISKIFSQIEDSETEVRSHYHWRRLGPDCIETYWREEFSSSCDHVHKYLKTFVKQHYFIPPKGTRYCSTPFQAISATSALMYFLNPAEALFGEAGVLEDPAYQKLKLDAIDEITEACELANLQRKRRVSPDSMKNGELAQLRAFLDDHHFPPGKEANSQVVIH